MGLMANTFIITSLFKTLVHLGEVCIPIKSKLEVRMKSIELGTAKTHDNTALFP